MATGMKTRRVVSKTVYHLFVASSRSADGLSRALMISGSFKTNYEILNEALKLRPDAFGWDNFIRGWKGFGRLTFAGFFRNSFVIASSDCRSHDLVRHRGTRLHGCGSGAGSSCSSA